MIRSTRLALLAGATLAALALTGCQNDSDLAGPASARVATHTADPTRVVAPPGNAGTLPPPPSAPSGTQTLRFTDSWGHTYAAVLNADGSSAHFVDGAEYAMSTPQAGGFNIAYIANGLIVSSQFMAMSGPQGLRGIGDLMPQRPTTNTRGPQAQQLIPCADFIASYIVASGELLAAGLPLSSGIRNQTTMTHFTAAAAKWAIAWVNLYNCEKGSYLTSAPPIVH
ncbi:MAG TPA: hypothetical protein VGI92_04450 [Gemmatimonadales bacterium]|jgi:hypothetical protein